MGRVSNFLYILLLAPIVALADDQRAHVFVREGEARAVIVASTDVPPLARFAARELQAYVKRATAAELPIVADLPADGTASLVVGNGSAARSLGVSADGLPWDGFVCKSCGPHLVILGRDDPTADPESDLPKIAGIHKYKVQMATVFGVYEFLERYLGVRWYLPLDEIGEVVPAHRDLAVPRLDEVVAPDCWSTSGTRGEGTGGRRCWRRATSATLSAGAGSSMPCGCGLPRPGWD